MPSVPLLARVILTWLAIFPLVAVARAVLGPLTGAWPDIAQTALAMAIVVPVAVIWAVPLLNRAYLRMCAGNRGKQVE